MRSVVIDGSFVGAMYGEGVGLIGEHLSCHIWCLTS